MFSKKKKIIILTIMVALLVVTGYLNIALNNNVTQPTSTTSNLDFYDSYRETRDTKRQESIALYDAIIADSTSSAEAKADAEAKRQELIEALEAELTIEGLIKKLGFDDAVLTSTTEKINIVVKAKAEDITKAQINQICIIVKDSLDVVPDNIRVIPSI